MNVALDGVLAYGRHIFKDIEKVEGAFEKVHLFGALAKKVYPLKLDLSDLLFCTGLKHAKIAPCLEAHLAACRVMAEWKIAPEMAKQHFNDYVPSERKLFLVRKLIKYYGTKKPSLVDFCVQQCRALASRDGFYEECLAESSLAQGRASPAKARKYFSNIPSPAVRIATALDMIESGPIDPELKEYLLGEMKSLISKNPQLDNCYLIPFLQVIDLIDSEDILFWSGRTKQMPEDKKEEAMVELALAAARNAPEPSFEFGQQVRSSFAYYSKFFKRIRPYSVELYLPDFISTLSNVQKIEFLTDLAEFRSKDEPELALKLIGKAMDEVDRPVTWRPEFKRIASRWSKKDEKASIKVRRKALLDIISILLSLGEFDQAKKIVNHDLLQKQKLRFEIYLLFAGHLKRRGLPVMLWFERAEREIKSMDPSSALQARRKLALCLADVHPRRALKLISDGRALCTDQDAFNLAKCAVKVDLATAKEIASKILNPKLRARARLAVLSEMKSQLAGD